MPLAVFKTVVPDRLRFGVWVRFPCASAIFLLYWMSGRLIVRAASVPPPLVSLHRVVVGTAGHIDHGKTQLVKALTGIDCDRWAEEKARGITIDLGFAYLGDGDTQIGFIDVPGHERFVHNALAGLGGIRIMLLVVAADEGVMPQTREHLAICSLLGIPSAIIVLTKKDLVSAELLDLAELEVLELLEGTPFAGSRIVRVSSLTNEGIDDLRETLFELSSRFETPTDPSAPARLPVDRAFHLRGLGVLVTGTLVSGTVRVGDGLELLPSRQIIRVRSIQVHGDSRQEAAAGERTSLQLTGASLEDLERGVQLVTPGMFEPSLRLCAEMQLLAGAPEPLRGSVPVRFHLLSSECMGTLKPLAPRELKPGEAGIVELQLSVPVTAVRGDRFIVRRPSPQTTLGGGSIVDPRWRRPRAAMLATTLEALCAGNREALMAWVQAEGERGVESEALARRLGLPPDRLAGDLNALVEAGHLLVVPEAQGRARRWLTRAIYERVVTRAQSVLREYFARDRIAKGIPKAEAVKRIVPAVPAHVASVYFSWLREQKVLDLQGDLVVLPGRSIELSPVEGELAASIRQRFEAAGLAPPSVDEVRSEISAADPRLFETAVRYLLQNGDLVRLPNGILIALPVVDSVRRELLAMEWERFSVPEFKERFGLTRKFAIPLLEYFDSTGLTRRVGEHRMVVRSA